MSKISREEAIKQEIKVAEESQKVVDTHIVFTDDNGDCVSVEEIYADDTEIIDAHLLHYQFCADYHKFIAEQLEKLEKIEKLIDECRAWPDDMAECLIENEQIVKEKGVSEDEL